MRLVWRPRQQKEKGVKMMEQQTRQTAEAEEAERVFHMWEPLRFETVQGYDYQRKGLLPSTGNALLRIFVDLILSVFDKIAFGFRIEGQENLKLLGERGAVTICNHLHPLDCSMVDLAVRRRRIYYITLEANFRIPVIRHLIRILGAVPLPHKSHTSRELFDAMAQAVQDGACVQIYPEGVMVPYCRKLRSFRNGAFRLAVKSGAPIFPMVIVQRKPSGIYRLYKNKPCLTLKVLPPIEADPSLGKREAADDLKQRCFDAMEQAMRG